MKYILIDLTRYINVIYFDGMQTHEYINENNLRNSEFIITYLNKLLKENNASLKEVDFLSVVLGPGSFTGIRIAVATTQALAFTLDKPIIAFNLFDSYIFNKNYNKTVVYKNKNTYFICDFIKTKNVKYFCLNESEFNEKNFKNTIFVEHKINFEKIIKYKFEKKEFTPFLYLKPFYMLQSQAEQQKSNKLNYKNE